MGAINNFRTNFLHNLVHVRIGIKKKDENNIIRGFIAYYVHSFLRPNQHSLRIVCRWPLNLNTILTLSEHPMSSSFSVYLVFSLTFFCVEQCEPLFVCSSLFLYSSLVLVCSFLLYIVLMRHVKLSSLYFLLGKLKIIYL